MKKQILSLAVFMMMMTGCKSNFAVVKQIGERQILVSDVETKTEKIFIFNRKFGESTDFLKFVNPGDTVLIQARQYDKNIEQVLESRNSSIYFNADSICARYERAKFDAAKQIMSTQNVRQ